MINCKIPYSMVLLAGNKMAKGDKCWVDNDVTLCRATYIGETPSNNCVLEYMEDDANSNAILRVDSHHPSKIWIESVLMPKK